MREPADLDPRVRAYVYNELMTTERAPTVSAVSNAMGVDALDVQGSFLRLADARMLILQPDGEVMAANPFANVTTSFVVEVGSHRYAALCVWDALGIPAMLRADAAIHTTCSDCNSTLRLDVENGTLRAVEAVAYFAVPAKRWWDNIVFS